MTAVTTLTTTSIAAAVLCLVAAGSAVAATRVMCESLRLGRSLALVRGIRLLILALVAALGALGLATGRPGFIVIGALILAEELYETGVLALVIRRGDAPPAGPAETG
jgi:hypothetical protein